MIKKLILAAAMLVAAMGFACAQVDVNKADAAGLDSVRGVGPKMSKAILEERSKGGQFKDWADFEMRVKGVGTKNAVRLSHAGLQVNGAAKAGAEPQPGDTMPAKVAEAKPAAKTKKEQ